MEGELKLEGSPESDIKIEEDKGTGLAEGKQSEETPLVDEGKETEPEVEKGEPSFKSQFKTWEETEKAFKEGQKKVTQTSQEKSDLLRRIEGYEKPKVPPIDELAERKKAIRLETLKKIKELPSDDPEREEKSTELWQEMEWKTAELAMEVTEKNKKDRSDGETYVNDKLRDAGFKKPKEIDLFWKYIVPQAPKYLKDAPLDEQIQWGVNKLTEFYSEFTEDFKKGLEEDGEEKKKLNVLGRGSGFTPGKKKDKDEGGLISIAEQQKQIKKERAFRGT